MSESIQAITMYEPSRPESCRARVRYADGSEIDLATSGLPASHALMLWDHLAATAERLRYAEPHEGAEPED